mgnify:CR=1 FL=1
MNQVGHINNNNTILDVDHKICELKQIFLELSVNINIIDISSLYLEFNRIIWTELINLINPFNPTLTMSKIQKKSFPFYDFIINNISIEDLIFLCNNSVDGPDMGDNTFLTMIGVIDNGFKLLSKIEKKTQHYKLNQIIWSNDHIFKCTRYGNYYTFKFFDNKLDNTIYNLKSDGFGNILLCACYNPDMRILKFYLNKYNQKINFSDVDLFGYFKAILSEHIPHKYQMRRLKLLNQYIALQPYYEWMILASHFISYKTFKVITKYYKKTDITSDEFFLKLKTDLKLYYESDGDEIFDQIIQYFTISDLKKILAQYYTTTCLNTPDFIAFKKSIIKNVLTT